MTTVHSYLITFLAWAKFPTHLQRSSIAWGAARAWPVPVHILFSFTLHFLCTLFFFFFNSRLHFLPIRAPQVKCWVTMRHTPCHEMNAEGTDYWQNSLSNPVHQHSSRKWEHRKCLALLSSKAPSLLLVFWLVHVSTSWLIQVTRNTAQQRRP